MGKFLNLMPKFFKKKKRPLPIETIFKLPSPIRDFSPGDGFATGIIDLGGLELCQLSSFTKIWATNEGGPNNVGATFYEPAKIPKGFFMLGCYSQSNSNALFGWILAGKCVTNDPSIKSSLAMPIDYTLVWSSESQKIKKEGDGYIWLPTPPEGYNAVGYVVTTSIQKPPHEKVRCVRADLTAILEVDSWIWGIGKEFNQKNFNVYGSRPRDRGFQALSVATGSFIIENGGNVADVPLPSCLRNTKNNLSAMPNLSQVQTLIQDYSPMIYFHPHEQYLPSTVNWYFQNGALLYKKGEEYKPSGILPNGSNLPQGGSDDDLYWLDLPIDNSAKESLKKGDLHEAGAYFHIKPMSGATFTDIAVWVFYPFNGPARAKVAFVSKVSLGKIGEHVGDWEHLTLRISNFNGELKSVYFSQHSGGMLLNAPEIEFERGNKPVAYASLHGHAFYPKPGLVLQGNGTFGLRNDTGKGMMMDTGVRPTVVAAEYLGSAVAEPPWLNYARKWGPKITYDTAEEISKVEKILPGVLKDAFRKFIKGLPREVLGEEGPTGPKMKLNWNGDEKY